MSGTAISWHMKDDGSAVVSVAGAVSVETCGEFHRVMTEAMDGSNRLEMDVAGLDGVDITTLQIFCSACRTASAQKKTICFAGGRLPDSLSLLAGDMGKPCIHNDNHICHLHGGA